MASCKLIDIFHMLSADGAEPMDTGDAAAAPSAGAASPTAPGTPPATAGDAPAAAAPAPAGQKMRVTRKQFDQIRVSKWQRLSTAVRSMGFCWKPPRAWDHRRCHQCSLSCHQVVGVPNF